MRNAHRSVQVRSVEGVTDRMAEDHAAMLEQKLEQVLNDAGVSLDAPGVNLKVQQNGLQFVYTVERDGLAISTFGYELDLTGIKSFDHANDLDVRTILG